MRPRFLRFALVWLVAASACSTAPIYDVADARLGGTATLEQRTQQIVRAARMQDWEVEQLQPNVMIAIKKRGRHVATTTIRYDETRFSLELRNSVDLAQSPTRIHKLYNEWVEGLENSIRQEVSAPGY